MGDHESRINKKNLNYVSREKNIPNHISQKSIGDPPIVLKSFFPKGKEYAFEGLQ